MDDEEEEEYNEDDELNFDPRRAAHVTGSAGTRDRSKTSSSSHIKAQIKITCLNLYSITIYYFIYR